MKKALLGILPTFLMMGVITASCDNTPGPGTAEIKVVDSQGNTQKKVHVTMYCTEPGCVVRRQGLTNDLGVYTEQFELPVVLRVRAVRYDSTYETIGLPPTQIKKLIVDSICGEGYVQIENDDIAQETITILDCN